MSTTNDLTDDLMDVENDSRLQPVFSGRLFRRQTLMLRGLRVRLGSLRFSRFADKERLETERARTQVLYVDAKKQNGCAACSEPCSPPLPNGMSLVHKQFSTSERETLLNLNQERQQTKKLKNDFIQNKASQKTAYEKASEELKQKSEEASLARKSARDSVKAKLDRERTAHSNKKCMNVANGLEYAPVTSISKILPQATRQRASMKHRP